MHNPSKKAENSRRKFLKTAAALVGPAVLSRAPATWASGAAAKPNDRIQLAAVGVRGRGNNLLTRFSAMPDVDMRYVCDIDQNVLAKRLKETRDGGQQATGLDDFRRALDDKEIDAICLGTPDHWHAIPMILACMAGKDVYTEKPDGHNIVESQRMTAAQERYGRVVQMGTQARSGPIYHQAVEYVRQGKLGKVRFAKAWESQRQRSLGHPPDAPVPAGVDYDTWLGPAPLRPFNPMRHHSNWRWFFDYGTGDLGNDGVHRIDYTRWLLQTALEAQEETLAPLPTAVSAHGGKHYFDDIQEWPDTLVAVYDYPNCVLTYEMRIWSPYKLHGEGEGGVVYGDRGYLVLGNRRWRAFDEGGEVVAESDGLSNLETTDLHIRNFLDCMRTRNAPAADLRTVGAPSSMLCHLANASWRAGRSLRYNAATGAFAGDLEANQFLTRERYRAPWTLPVIDT
jgi:predicted dehydrogenase